MRKHFTQLNKNESDCIIRHIRDLRPILTGYSNFRCNTRKVTIADISAVIQYGKLIEIHNDSEPDIRALLRGKVSGLWVCVVVSLVTGEIITAYKNNLLDNHKTLDKTLYNWHGDLREILKEILKI